MAEQPKAGDTFTHQRTCDRYRPLYYAGASGDFNPIHIDAEVGKLAGFDGPILQGLCTLAWAVEAVTRQLPDPGKLKKLRVRFSRPVLIGDDVTFQGAFTSVEPAEADATGKQVARGELTVKNQRGEDVLKNATFEAEL
jgi:acyl dehydratase